VDNKIYIIAGEKSGDKLGSDLMFNLNLINSDFVFCGVGGPLMQAEGLVSIFPMEELSLMGIFEILPKLPRLFHLRDTVVKNIISSEVSCLITIDSPEFSFSVSRKVKKSVPNLKIIHYVAPSLWAWRPKRGYKIAKFIDHILALFPFEPKIMQEFGISCDFVGHPISSLPTYNENELSIIRNKLNIEDDELLLVVLPGSRVSEIKRLLPIFLKSLEILNTKITNIKIILPSIGSTVHLIEKYLESSLIGIEVFSENDLTAEEFETLKFELFCVADFALAASGTVTLELAAAKTPMIVSYDVNFFSRIILKFLLKIDSISLVNIILNRKLVPEFLGKECKPILIADALINLIEDDNLASNQRSGLMEVIRILGGETTHVSNRAAHSINKFLKINL
jgi:lipid-A-disaccharide synthase|tara:strand:+ start:2275 stop:3459 length:1185 start_codon:yes stop_codon:yes gene_type:complete